MMKHAIISGGGIGGLALATGLGEQGWSVTVIERAPSWRPLGAGLILGPHAQAVLGALGLTDHITPVHVADRLEIHGCSGAVLSTSAQPYWTVHRAELHAGLLSASRARATFRLGCTVTAVAQDSEGCAVTLSDGTVLSADLLVGADGLHSGVRGLLQPRITPRYAGYTCWRTVGPNQGSSDRIVERWGRGLRLGTVPLSGGRVYVFACANAPAGASDPPDPWPSFIERFSVFGSDTAALLSSAAASGSSLLRHDILELPRTVWGSGRATLLGDASHAMTPNTGSGAAMALEDALALCLSLRNEPDLDVALAAYQRLRHRRVTTAARDARMVGILGQWSWGWSTWLRDTLVAATPARFSAQQLESMVSPGLALARAYREGAES